jgi:hypothetical protein
LLPQDSTSPSLALSVGGYGETTADATVSLSNNFTFLMWMNLAGGNSNGNIVFLINDLLGLVLGEHGDGVGRMYFDADATIHAQTNFATGTTYMVSFAAGPTAGDWAIGVNNAIDSSGTGFSGSFGNRIYLGGPPGNPSVLAQVQKLALVPRPLVLGDLQTIYAYGNGS